ncbi:MAG: hypothetical protein RI911_877 [Candidatus Parcubacteria bacterium]|jgi:hypothetical protein
MQNIQNIVTTAGVSALAFATSASAQIQGVGGGEGSGSSNNSHAFAVNPQNIGIDENLASAASTDVNTLAIALVCAAICGVFAYVLLNKAFAKQIA